eukprot:gene970-565_t
MTMMILMVPSWTVPRTPPLLNHTDMMSLRDQHRKDEKGERGGLHNKKEMDKDTALRASADHIKMLEVSSIFMLCCAVFFVVVVVFSSLTSLRSIFFLFFLFLFPPLPFGILLGSVLSVIRYIVASENRVHQKYAALHCVFRAHRIQKRYTSRCLWAQEEEEDEPLPADVVSLVPLRLTYLFSPRILYVQWISSSPVEHKKIRPQTAALKGNKKEG